MDALVYDRILSFTVTRYTPVLLGILVVVDFGAQGGASPTHARAIWDRCKRKAHVKLAEQRALRQLARVRLDARNNIGKTDIRLFTMSYRNCHTRREGRGCGYLARWLYAHAVHQFFHAQEDNADAPRINNPGYLVWLLVGIDIRKGIFISDRRPWPRGAVGCRVAPSQLILQSQR